MSTSFLDAARVLSLMFPDKLQSAFPSALCEAMWGGEWKRKPSAKGVRDVDGKGGHYGLRGQFYIEDYCRSTESSKVAMKQIPISNTDIFVFLYR